VHLEAPEEAESMMLASEMEASDLTGDTQNLKQFIDGN